MGTILTGPVKTEPCPLLHVPVSEVMLSAFAGWASREALQAASAIDAAALCQRRGLLDDDELELDANIVVMLMTLL